VKTSSSRKSGTDQSSGCGAVSPVAVTGASPGSAVRQFWRNELICKNADKSMRQVSRRQPAGRSRHCLPRHCLPGSAAVLAKQSHRADFEDRRLPGGRRFRRDDAAGVSRNLTLARRHRRVARRGSRSFSQNELICRNADKSMGRVSPPLLARGTSPDRLDRASGGTKPTQMVPDCLRHFGRTKHPQKPQPNQGAVGAFRTWSVLGGGEPPQAEARLLGLAPDRIGPDLPCHHQGLIAAATSRAADRGL